MRGEAGADRENFSFYSDGIRALFLQSVSYAGKSLKRDFLCFPYRKELSKATKKVVTLSIPSSSYIPLLDQPVRDERTGWFFLSFLPGGEGRGAFAGSRGQETFRPACTGLLHAAVRGEVDFG